MVKRRRFLRNEMTAVDDATARAGLLEWLDALRKEYFSRDIVLIFREWYDRGRDCNVVMVALAEERRVA